MHWLIIYPGNGPGDQWENDIGIMEMSIMNDRLPMWPVTASLRLGLGYLFYVQLLLNWRETSFQELMAQMKPWKLCLSCICTIKHFRIPT